MEDLEKPWLHGVGDNQNQDHLYQSFPVLPPEDFDSGTSVAGIYQNGPPLGDVSQLRPPDVAPPRSLWNVNAPAFQPPEQAFGGGDPRGHLDLSGGGESGLTHLDLSGGVVGAALSASSGGMGGIMGGGGGPGGPLSGEMVQQQFFDETCCGGGRPGDQGPGDQHMAGGTSGMDDMLGGRNGNAQFNNSDLGTAPQCGAVPRSELLRHDLAHSHSEQHQFHNNCHQQFNGMEDNINGINNMGAPPAGGPPPAPLPFAPANDHFDFGVVPLPPNIIISGVSTSDSALPPLAPPLIAPSSEHCSGGPSMGNMFGGTTPEFTSNLQNCVDEPPCFEEGRLPHQHPYSSMMYAPTETPPPPPPPSCMNSADYVGEDDGLLGGSHGFGCWQVEGGVDGRAGGVGGGAGQWGGQGGGGPQWGAGGQEHQGAGGGGAVLRGAAGGNGGGGQSQW